MTEFRLTRKLTKVGNQITEVIECSPKINILQSETRSVSIFIRIMMSLYSMAHHWKVTDIISPDFFTRITIMEYKGNLVPEIYSELKFKYTPVLGKKKCSLCIHSRDNGGYCWIRSCRIKGDFWKKCVYFFERSVIEKC